MPTIIGDAFVEIKPESKNFSREAESGIKGQMKDVAKVAAGAFAATFAAEKIFDFGKESVKAADEARKIAAQTGAVIKSTQGVANVGAEEVEKLARSLSHMSGVEDDTIAKAENLLLTFTNIRNRAGEGNDIFDQTTTTLLDMSVALGKDAPGAAIQLGKALNDPTKGLLALTRVGVSFTAQQKEQIKALQASGDLVGAQKLILAELNREFAGSAQAQATAGAKFHEFIHELQEDLGARLLPVIDTIETGLMQGIPVALDAAASVLRGAGAIFEPIAQGARGLFAEIFDPNKGALGKSNFQRGLEVVQNEFDAFLLGRSTKNAATAAQVAKNFGIPEQRVAGPAAPQQGGLLGVTLADVQHDKTILAIADENASNLDKVTAKVANTISDVFNLGIEVHPSQIDQNFKAGFDVIKTNFITGSQEVASFLSSHGGEALGNAILDVGNATAAVVPKAGQIIGDAFGAIDRFLGDNPGDLFQHIRDGLGNGVLNALDLGAGLVQAGVGGVVTRVTGSFLAIVNGVGAGIDAILATPGAIAHAGEHLVNAFATTVSSAAAGAATDLVDAGSAMVGGVVRGITSSGEQITKAILSFIPTPGDVVDFFKKGAGVVGGVISGAKHLFGGATGGTVLSGGSLLVGERGPEIVRLPAGASITPNDRLANLSRGGATVGVGAGSTFHVEQLIVPSPPDASPLEVASTIAEHFAWRFGMEAA